jgi:hypothetical protein
LSSSCRLSLQLIIIIALMSPEYEGIRLAFRPSNRKDFSDHGLFLHCLGDEHEHQTTRRPAGD